MKSINENIPVMGTGAALSNMTRLVLASLRAGISPRNMKVVFLTGGPGVGKSQCVSQLAENIHQQTGMQVNLVKIELQFSTPPDLKGLPVADPGSDSARWLLSTEFKLDPDPRVLNIIFLDELTDALPSVLAAAKTLILERRVADHALPDNTLIIAAGNRAEDKATVSRLPGPLANRFMHFSVKADYPQWEAWAKKAGVHPAVLAFLHANPDKLVGEPTHSAFPTPRTWVDVSDILHLMDSTPDAESVMIGALVGMGLAAEFSAWYRCCQNLPSFQDILQGKGRVRGMLTSDQAYYLVMGLSNALQSARSLQLRCAVEFALLNFTAEYQTLFFTMLMERGLRNMLLHTDLYLDWLKRNPAFKL